MLDKPDCLPILMICTDDETHIAFIAQRLCDRLATCKSIAAEHPWFSQGLPVFVAFPEHSVLHDAMNRANGAAKESTRPCELIPFARTDAILSHDPITNSSQRALAIAINASYKKGRR